MEEITGGQLSGSVQGEVIGAARLVPGKQGLALYLSGNQRVNWGNQRHNCMGNFNLCTNGFVMAMWLQMHKHDPPGAGHFTDTCYMSSGGTTKNAIGVALLMRVNKLLFVFRLPTKTWNLFDDEFIQLNTWHHVVMAWNEASGGKAYINGALRVHLQTGQGMTNNQNPAGYEDFVIGDLNKGAPKLPAEMTIDELRFWDVVMEDHEVLALYAADLLP